MVEGPEAQKTQSHVIFLENFYPRANDRLPAGKKFANNVII